MKQLERRVIEAFNHQTNAGLAYDALAGSGRHAESLACVQWGYSGWHVLSREYFPSQSLTQDAAEPLQRASNCSEYARRHP